MRPEAVKGLIYSLKAKQALRDKTYGRSVIYSANDMMTY